MKDNTYCSLEKTVIESKLNNSLTVEQEEHINNCSICSDSLIVHSWMNKFDKTSTNNSEHILPASEAIWQKAFSSANNKKDLIKKAMRPLIIAQYSAYIFAFVGAIFLLFGKSPVLGNLFDGISKKSGILDSFSTLLGSISKTLPFLIVPLGLVSLLLISYFIYSFFEPENA